MKKFSIAMLSMVLAGSMLLTGCGGSKTADSSSDAQDSTTSTSADGGTLRMGTNATFPPYEFVGDDGNVQGIDADIAAAIADKLGMKLEITDMEFDSLIPALQSDTIDVALAGMTVTPDRQENVDFSDSYAKGVQVIIVKDGSDIASPDDLEGKNIGVQTGTTGDIYCTGDYGQEHVKQFNNGPLAVAALVNDQIDCVVIDQEPAKNYVDINVAREEKDPDSVLNYFRRMVAFRKANPEFVYGTYTLIEATHPQVYAYLRESDERKFLIALNFSPKPASIRPQMNLEGAEALMDNYNDHPAWDKTLLLRPYEALIVRYL